jgi:tetratricopeptide (TPR) repeat protein
MKRALIVMALLAVSAVAGAVVYTAAARERDYRQLLASGDAALANEQTFSAIEAYSGAIALRPDSMYAHLRRGETYLQRGDLDGAARDLRTAAALDPTATRPLDEWGEVLYRQQRFRRSAEVYENRLRLDDRSAPTFYRLGLARYRDGAFDQAIAAHEQALRLDPRMAEARYMIGMSQRQLGRLKEAEAAFAAAVAESPGLIAAREELADVYRETGRRAEESRQLEVLAGIDTGRIDRRIAVGLAHARAGHADLAVLTLANTLEQAPDNLSIYAALGRVWLEIAENRNDRPDALAKALEALERAASAPSATSETKTLYGRALLRGQQPEAAERVLQQATERYPADPEAFELYAQVAERLRHYDVARTSLLSYSALVGEDANFGDRARRIAELSLLANDLPAAIQWFGRASAAAPADVRPLAGLADAHARAGDTAAALEAIARGLAVDASNATLLRLQRRLATQKP